MKPKLIQDGRTDLTENMIKLDVSEGFAHTLKATRMSIFEEINSVVADCHGASGLAVCC